MKKILLLLLFAPFSNLVAQNYTLFPDSNAVWVNGDYGVDWSGEIPEFVLYNATNYCMTNQDTTIGANVYSQLFICGENYVGALRDNGGQVYYVPKDSLSELLIYDFTVTTGQVLTDIYPGNFIGYTVGVIDSVLIGETYRTRIHFSSGFWLEGVGCSMGLFNDPLDDLDGMQDLLCMGYLDTSFYPNYGFGYCPMDLGFNDQSQTRNQILTFPNPTNGSFIIETGINSSIESIVVTNSMGQNVEAEICVYNDYIQIDLSSFPVGIYFVTLTNTSGKFIGKIIKE